jgi:biopolymer transport protein TolR
MTAMSMRRHRKRKLKSEINVVPYIDVMLVLLVIFMVTAPLLNLSVDVTLPKSNARSVENKKDPVIVSVDPAGNYFLATKPGDNRSVSASDLEAHMRGLARENKELTVMVAGDPTTDYQKVMNALDLLQRAGVAKVGMISDPAGKGAAR